MRPRALGKERALADPDLLEKWFSGMKMYLNSQDPSLLLSADRIFNADETGFALAPKSRKVLAPTGCKNIYGMTNNTRQQITVLACSSAAGEYTGSLIVYPRKRMPSQNLLDGFEEAFLQISANGWMSAAIFKTWLADVFIPFVQAKKNLLFFLWIATTVTSLLLTMCDDNGVIMYGLHPHASNIIQPLDLSVFGSMKATWPSIVKTHLNKIGEVARAANFAKLLKELWGKCATAEGGLEGFMRSGIYPYNPDRPLSSGKMEAIKSFKTPAHLNQSPDGATDQLPPPPPQHEAAASAIASSSASTEVASDMDKWDALSACSTLLTAWDWRGSWRTYWLPRITVHQRVIKSSGSFRNSWLTLV